MLFKILQVAIITVTSLDEKHRIETFSCKDIGDSDRKAFIS